jgi:hypothetical protein
MGIRSHIIKRTVIHNQNYIRFTCYRQVENSPRQKSSQQGKQENNNQNYNPEKSLRHSCID